jgi:hypothetical protein
VHLGKGHPQVLVQVREGLPVQLRSLVTHGLELQGPAQGLGHGPRIAHGDHHLLHQRLPALEAQGPQDQNRGENDQPGGEYHERPAQNPAEHLPLPAGCRGRLLFGLTAHLTGTLASTLLCGGWLLDRPLRGPYGRKQSIPRSLCCLSKLAQLMLNRGAPCRNKWNEIAARRFAPASSPAPS